jgi:hypothetical protein
VVRKPLRIEAAQEVGVLSSERELGKQDVNLPLLAGLASGNKYEAVTQSPAQRR